MSLDFSCKLKEAYYETKLKIVQKWKEDWNRFETRISIKIGDEWIDFDQNGLTSYGMQFQILNSLERELLLSKTLEKSGETKEMS